MSYRYLLTRSFPRSLFDTAVEGLFIGLNPSTADEHHDDATVRRWTGFAKSWGWSGYRVVNLYAWRATDPAELRKAAYPVGPNNDRVIARQIGLVNGPVVCCWGAHAQKWRVCAVLELLRSHGTTPYALKLTRHGDPAHVLYLPAELTPRPLSELETETGCNAL